MTTQFHIIKEYDTPHLRIFCAGVDHVSLPLAAIEAAIARYHEDQRLVVRKRTMHGLDMYWIGRGKGRGFVPYGDIYSPTGYGFRSKALADRCLGEIEARLRQGEEARKP